MPEKFEGIDSADINKDGKINETDILDLKSLMENSGEADKQRIILEFIESFGENQEMMKELKQAFENYMEFLEQENKKISYLSGENDFYSKIVEIYEGLFNVEYGKSSFGLEKLDRKDIINDIKEKAISIDFSNYQGQKEFFDMVYEAKSKGKIGQLGSDLINELSNGQIKENQWSFYKVNKLVGKDDFVYKTIEKKGNISASEKRELYSQLEKHRAAPNNGFKKMTGYAPFVDMALKNGEAKKYIDADDSEIDFKTSNSILW